MYSVLKPTVIYQDTSPHVTEHDLNVVADTWEMDGREVYRGTRDPRYIHANVFWLYDDSLERVGCVEHDLADHANFKILWFRDSEFGTLLQEDGWEAKDDIWSHISRQVFDRFVNEGWTSPKTFLEQCLHGPVRIVTPSMAVSLPLVYTCIKCGRKSLSELAGCEMVGELLDFPDKGKIFFVDDDFIVQVPPTRSAIWSRLHLQHDDDSSQEPVREPEQTEPLQTEPSPPPPAAQADPPRPT